MKRSIAFGVLLTALVASSACGSGSDDPPPGGPAAASGPASSAPPSAAALLTAAVAKLDGQSLRYTVTGSKGTISGGFDAATRGVSFSAGTTTRLEYVVLGDEVYLKGADPQGRWWHLSVSRFPSGSTLLVVVDPLFGVKFLAAAQDVKETSPGTFTGVIDLTKVAAGGAASQLADGFAKADPAGAASTPFTATVDSQGRLTGVKATFRSTGKATSLPYDLKIVEYGATVQVVRPARDQTIEAPPEAYQA